MARKQWTSKNLWPKQPARRSAVKGKLILGSASNLVIQNQENPDTALNWIHDLNKATVQSVKDAANKYLNENNLIKLILLPEKK